MINRIVALFGAVLMVCASPFSSAWDAQSFVADSPDYYTMFPSDFSSSNSVFADSSESSSDSLSSYDIFYNGSWVTSPSLLAHVYLPETEEGYYPPVTLPAKDFFLPYPDSGLSLSLDSSSTTTVRWASDYLTVPLSLAEALRDGGQITGVTGLYGIRYDNDDQSDPNVIRYGMEFQLDISSLGSFDTFEIGGSFQLTPFVRLVDGSSNPCLVNRVDLHVNGSLFTSFSSSDGYIVNAPLTIVSYPETITSISLVVVYEPCSEFSWTDSTQYCCYVGAFFNGDDSDLSIHVLNGEAALDGFNDEAQDSINSHEQIESEWVQTSSDNFAALDIENFSIPSSLLSGFALISGIFTDIWNGLGDYRLVFVLPLTLGVILVVVGRIARTAGSQSSRNKGGDGNA